MGRLVSDAHSPFSALAATTEAEFDGISSDAEADERQSALGMRAN
jgi:hypothetical protein